MPTFKLKWMNVHTPSLILTQTHTQNHTLKSLFIEVWYAASYKAKQDVCIIHIWFTEPTSEYRVQQPFLRHRCSILFCEWNNTTTLNNDS